jgi:hypothetical protein
MARVDVWVDPKAKLGVMFESGSAPWAGVNEVKTKQRPRTPETTLYI